MAFKDLVRISIEVSWLYIPVSCKHVCGLVDAEWEVSEETGAFTTEPSLGWIGQGRLLVMPLREIFRTFLEFSEVFESVS